MSLSPERTPGHEHRKAAASLLLNRIALGLIQDARRRRGFGDDEAALRSRATRLAAELAGDTGAELEQDPVELELRSDGRIELSVPFDAGFREWAELREDGVVLGGGTEGPSRTRTLRTEDMKPWEKEEQRRRDLACEAARGKPKFRGKRYLRTLVAPPQPGTEVRILAIELYADGLIVEFTYDTEPLSEEQMESMFYPPRPPMRVEDDVGTDYYEGERASYGGSPGAY
ncbi:MAG TPA: hypothetical protein VHU24_04200, partial [Solirubrobacterales bacterium]|nr:hypothetical protein [Solirubrobacterales bacterium]